MGSPHQTKKKSPKEEIWEKWEAVKKNAAEKKKS